MSKRIFDLCLASLALVLLSPVMVAVAVLVKRDSRGPVFELVRRAGRGGIAFNMIRFRSKQTSEPSDGAILPLDPTQATASSALIAKYKLDKLPQLINVLRGEMSLVGPQPELEEAVEHYSWRERRVLLVRPGLTDWASMWNDQQPRVLAGAPDPHEAYQRVIHPDKIRLQTYYVENRTLWMDCRIVMCRLWKLVNRRFAPRELAEYPTSTQLRARVARLVATEQIYRRAA